ncbi:bifunctional NAD(P)/FAD-dependent oxidoreductase/class I SAM-dependent methyltransferase [Amycolatopsis sp. GM8]|uniref:bifunctional NAD(P)/FAD-dependent oxidoreductase/class I SAM-dependent methyltransferase n=1 Tax=Amycolatopsis sp. GM8 TaxID=2896530 RepID=UPI001F27F328|nr:bifunctional NAD(P)/FAD-dependent oxidoreductase/class I SAM-dependent methyltransferase [Amycolatopsis sp. GM8]
MNEKYDVVIVGGGAAGLAGATALARARRSVLVIDAGEPRNAPAGHVHNYLGREGTPPRELVAIGRAEVAGYGGEFADGTVSAAKPLDGQGFQVTLTDGREIRARRLLVTTGLTDELPELPGVAELWGSDVLHCPYCHGWEVRDQPVGIIGAGPMSVHQALLWRQWTGDVVLFRHTGPVPSAQERAQLAARDIRFVDDEVAALEISDGHLTGVRMRSGQVVPRAAVVVTPKFTARADVLVSLGLETTELEVGGQVVGSYVPADPTGATSLPGVWVAGNVANAMAQVISSAAGGLTAGAAINGDLMQEDVRDAMSAEFTAAQEREVAERVLGHRGHGMPVVDREWWEELYRTDTKFWSGQPNAQLVAEVSDLPPGTALDAGCGEGGDAVWLAERGWRVTGADFVGTALERAAGHAKEAGVEVDWVRADVTSWTPPARFDLVTSHFLQVLPDERAAAFARLADAVAPGGTLLIVGHALSMAHHGDHPPEKFFTADEVAASLGDGWRIQVAEERPRVVHGIPSADVVLRARRSEADGQ